MNKNDELLNKYIDGELQGSEIEEVQAILKDDAQVKKLKALQAVDNSLKKLEYDSAPHGFTEKVMRMISVQSEKILLPKNYFAITINIVFTSIIAFLLIYAFSFVKLDFSSTTSDGQLISAINSMNKNISAVLTFFQDKFVMFWGSILSLFLLLGIYSLNEAHKSFKKKIENISMK